MTKIQSCISLMILLLVWNCSSASQKKSGENKDLSNKIRHNDTISIRERYLEYVSPLSYKDTLVVIDGIPLLLSCYSETDTVHLYTDTLVYEEKGKIHQEIYTGYNTSYKITLKEKDNTLFTLTFNKEHFRNILNPYTLCKGEAYLPELKFYASAFTSFVFTVDFWIPESDVGEHGMLMVDKTGRLYNITHEYYYGGGDCDGEIEMPEDEKFIVSCTQIFHPNGQKIDITQPHLAQVGVKLINDKIILVIQEFTDTLNQPNARLIDTQGKTLKTFVFKGYYNVLGYTVPWHYDSHFEQYILLDEEQEHIRIINKKSPLSTYTVSFAEMKPYRDDTREHEIIFNINTEFSENFFALDTVEQIYRHKQKKYGI